MTTLVAGAPLLAGGPPGWVAYGVLAVVTIGGAYVISQSMSTASDEAETKLETGTATDACSTCGEPPECKDLNEKIKSRRDELVKRYQDMREDKGDLFNLKPTGPMSWQGHVDQFLDKQQNLRKQLDNAETKGCKPPSDARKWASQKPPTQPAPK